METVKSHDTTECQPRRSNNNVVSPPKPPRKAPSQSPPSMRRSEHAHYARPAADPATGRSSKMVSSMMEQLSQDSRFRRHRMAMETSGDEDLGSIQQSRAGYRYAFWHCNSQNEMQIGAQMRMTVIPHSKPILNTSKYSRYRLVRYRIRREIG